MINPIEIPRPNQLEDIYKNTNKENLYLTNDEIIPPYPTTNYNVEETQNSSCRLIRSSLTKIPQDQSSLNNSGLQFSLYLQPFAEPNEQEKETPKVESKIK
jgi:tmRNA-binding protein